MVALIAAVVAPAGARADGDPGSDVLVYQDLFAGSDAGLSVQQQVQLGASVEGGRAGGLSGPGCDHCQPVRSWGGDRVVAPPAHVRPLPGIELSLAYKQRLLVVMPNGFGFNWAGHSADAGYRALAGIPIGPGGAGLFNATEAAVGKLAMAGGVKLSSVARSAGASTAPAGPGGSATQRPGKASGIDEVLGIVSLALLAIAGVAFAVYRFARRRGWHRPRFSVRSRFGRPRSVGGWRFRVGMLLLVARGRVRGRRGAVERAG